MITLDMFLLYAACILGTLERRLSIRVDECFDVDEVGRGHLSLVRHLLVLARVSSAEEGTSVSGAQLRSGPEAATNITYSL